MKPVTDVDVLIVGYFADALSRAEFALLQDALRTSADARRRLAEISRHDVLLHRILASEAAMESPDRFDVSPNISGNASGKRLRWLPPLAMAAGLLVAFGLSKFLQPAASDHAIGRLTHSVGPVLIEDTANPNGTVSTIRTPAGSFARLEQKDGTMIALADNGRFNWQTSLQTGIKTLGVAKGQAVLDIVPQKDPFVILAAGGMQAQVHGTRIWTSVKPSGEERTHVFSGRLLIGRSTALPATASPGENDPGHGAWTYRTGNVFVSLGPGQTLSHYFRSADRRGMAVFPFGDDLEPLGWTEQLGLNPADWSDSSQGALNTQTLPDVSRIEIMNGVWQFDRDGQSVRAFHSGSEIGHGTIFFGPQQWIKGEFSCKVKLPEIKKDDEEKPAAWIGMAFLPLNANAIVHRTALLQVPAGIYRLRGMFEVVPENNTILLHEFEISMPKARPKRMHSERDQVLLPTPELRKSGPSAPGVYVSGVNAEFFDIRLENAVAAPAADLAAAPGSP